jgi:hypothetical protein
LSKVIQHQGPVAPVAVLVIAWLVLVYRLFSLAL